MPLTIAIDGPVGAGKSTISDQVAQRLGIPHLDTGAMYRAVGKYCLDNSVNTLDKNAVTDLCLQKKILVEIRYEDGMQRTLLNGADVTDLIRTPEIGQAASDVSTFPEVRQMLVAKQQEFARSQSTLLDGRDIGTVVLPHATVKIFLTATPESRAARRLLQLRQAGKNETFEDVLRMVNERDYQDMNREADPLCQAEDAVLLDSSDLTFEETVQKILSIVEEKLA